MSTTLDKTELSYVEKEFIYNIFSNDKISWVDSLYAKRHAIWFASALFFSGICVVGIVYILFS